MQNGGFQSVCLVGVKHIANYATCWPWIMLDYLWMSCVLMRCLFL